MRAMHRVRISKDEGSSGLRAGWPLLVGLLLWGGCKAKGAARVSVDAEEGASLSVEGRAEVAGEGVPLVHFRLEGDELLYEGPGEVRFATNSAKLAGDRTEATLEALAAFLLEHPEVEIHIEGHTDSRGSEAYNLDLSRRRAESVADFLADQGVERDRMTFEGYGESRPKVEEPDECRDRTEATAPAWCDERVWSQNRRTEFHVTAGRETIAVPERDAPGRAAGRDGAREEGWFRGAYLYGAPVFFMVPLFDADGRDYRRISYQWGLGAGYLFAPRRVFRVGLGGSFEHAPVTVEAAGRCFDEATGDLSERCDSMHDLELELELRLGGASRRVFGYGLLGPGLPMGTTDTGFWAGFSWTFGTGLWVRVWRGLFLGLEVGTDLMTFGAQGNDPPYDGFMADFEFEGVLGWHFGWRDRRR